MVNEDQLIERFKMGLDAALAESTPPVNTDKEPAFALAVSGGADSMALTHLAVSYLGPERLTALSVDHGLRSAAQEECEQVAQWMNALGVSHVVLNWDGEKPHAGLQNAAREARYRLLENWCVANNVPYLLLGHHLRDQAETLILRLARGSGLWGLAAMPRCRAPLFEPNGPQTLRPMLDISHQDLRDFLTARQQCWVEDPSNDDMSYDRVKVRAFLAAPPVDGLNPERLAQTAQRLSSAKSALAFYVDRAIVSYVNYDALGFAKIDLDGLLQEPREVVLKILSIVLQNISGAPYPVRFANLKAVLDACLTGVCHRTLGGCELVLRAGSALFVYREVASVQAQSVLTAQPSDMLWDGRFLISAQECSGKMQIRPLREEGWAHLKALGCDLKCSFKVGVTQPSLWQNDLLCAAPTLGYHNADMVRDLKMQFSPRIGAFGVVNLDLES